jgi:hypothetical protein
MTKIKYIVELSIDSTWIADGFDIRNNQDVKDLLQQLLPYAYSNEVSGRVISKPKLSIVKKLQGYLK